MYEYQHLLNWNESELVSWNRFGDYGFAALSSINVLNDQYIGLHGKLVKVDVISPVDGIHFRNYLRHRGKVLDSVIYGESLHVVMLKYGVTRIDQIHHRDDCELQYVEMTVMKRDDEVFVVPYNVYTFAEPPIRSTRTINVKMVVVADNGVKKIGL